MPTTRSARRWVGLRRDSASRTDRQICAQRVAVPEPLLSMSSGPSRLMLPAITVEPRSGNLPASPVIPLSGSRFASSRTTPSTGMRSHGRNPHQHAGAYFRNGRRVSALPSTTVATHFPPPGEALGRAPLGRPAASR